MKLANKEEKYKETRGFIVTLINGLCRFIHSASVYEAA